MVSWMNVLLRSALVVGTAAAMFAAGWSLRPKMTAEAVFTAYAKYVAGQPSHKQQLENGTFDTVLSTNYGKLNGVTSAEVAAARRAAMGAYLFRGEPAGMARRPDQVERNALFPPLADLSVRAIDVLTVTMPHGVESAVYYLRARRSQSCLMIYQEGHRVSFLERKRFLTRLVDEGCDVLALSLPLTGGMNARPLIDHPRLGRILLNDPDDLQLLDSQSYSSLAYFLMPLIAGLNHALDEQPYQRIGATGFSGGGWAVQVFSALDPRIQATYSVAGSSPAAVHAAKPEWGSPEQREGRFYELVNYPELYVMAADRPGRRHLQFFNETDPCCFAGQNWQAWNQPLAEAAQRLGGHFAIFTYSHGLHAMTKPVALTIIDDFLHNGREPAVGVTAR